MRPTDKATADSRSLQSFAIIKNTGQGNLVIGRFHARARNGLSVWDLPVYSRALPPHTTSPIFLGEGAAVHRLSGTDTDPVFKLSAEIDGLSQADYHSKLKLFHFQSKKYYLSDKNHQTDNLSHTNNPSLVWKRPFLL